MAKRILIHIDWYKPGFKAGGPIRSVSNLVDHISDKAEIFIITRDTDYLETKPYPTIKSDQWNKINNESIYYLSSKSLHYKNIKQLIKEVKPDIVYCNSLYSPYFTLIPLYIAKKLNIKTVLAVRGMLSKGSLSVKNKKKKAFLSISKVLGIYNECTFHASNENEKEEIASTFGNDAKIIIAQNLPEKKNLQHVPKSKKENELLVTFVGRIAPEKNILFAIESLMNCKQRITFDIYGPIYNEEYWQECNQTINQLPEHIVVNYRDVLNHDLLDETLQKYHVLYLPSTGENFGHIIVEAMINSCIPLISDRTPWKNLKERNIGFDISLNEQDRFTESLDKLSKMNEKELNSITKNAYNFAHEIINDNRLIEDYYKLFQLNN